MAASSTSADQPSASATSPTMSPDPSSKPAGSDLSYTVDYDEPKKDGYSSMTGADDPLESTLAPKMTRNAPTHDTLQGRS